MIKHFVLFLALVFSCLSYAQNDISPKFQISPLTEVMLKKYYSEEEIKEIMNVESELKMIDYLFSKSFEIVSIENRNIENLLKIDILKLNQYRNMEKDIIVFDSESNIKINLYSFQKVNEEKSKFENKNISSNHKKDLK